MNTEAFKLARATLRLAVREYGFTRQQNGGGRYRYKYGPGRFEGEHWSIVHWYNAYMNGFGEPHVGCEIFDTITAAERDAFDLERSTVAIALEFSETGFVSCTELDAEELANLREVEELDEPEGY